MLYIVIHKKNSTIVNDYVKNHNINKIINIIEHIKHTWYVSILGSKGQGTSTLLSNKQFHIAPWAISNCSSFYKTTNMLYYVCKVIITFNKCEQICCLLVTSRDIGILLLIDWYEKKFSFNFLKQEKKLAFSAPTHCDYYPIWCLTLQFFLHNLVHTNWWNIQ